MNNIPIRSKNYYLVIINSPKKLKFIRLLSTIYSRWLLHLIPYSPVNKTINNSLHASTLAFELSCLGEKIITNCGSINREIINENDYLRYSAAHSTIIVNNTNISELNKKSYIVF